MMKIRKIILVLLCSLVLIGSSQQFVFDNAQIFNAKTVKLIQNKNLNYQKTKIKPQIIVQTFNYMDNLKPKKIGAKQLFIVVGQKDKKQNVQIYPGKDLQDIFTTQVINNIISSDLDELRSTKNINQGIRYVFNACATLIDQKYKMPHDTNTLTDTQLQKIAHPRGMNLPIALLIAAIITLVGYLWHKKCN